MGAVLAPYEQAVSELKVKLRGIRKQFREQDKHIPIEFVTGRVKPVDSILTKTAIRHIPLNRIEEEMQDIAGLRIMCQFVEDIYQVVALLRNRKDLKLWKNGTTLKIKRKWLSFVPCGSGISCAISHRGKDYFGRNPNSDTLHEFWATIEHSLNYKYQGVFPEEMKERLQRAAEAAYLLDEEMSSIREEIQEAQHYFSHGRGLLENEYYKQIKNETPENQ